MNNPTYQDLEDLIEDNELDEVFVLFRKNAKLFKGYQDLEEVFIYDRPEGRAYIKFKRALKMFIGKVLNESNGTIETHWLAYPAQQLPKQIIGRVDDLQKIHQDLTEHKQLLINGLGGIGKTTLGLYYLEEYAQEYNYILWVQYQEDWISSLVSAVDEDSLNGDWKPTGNVEQDAKILNNILAKLGGKKLLIVDNVDDVDALAELPDDLPQDWYTIITSRSRNEDLVEFRTDLLSMEAAKELYLLYHPLPKTASEESGNDLIALVDLLKVVGNHTLAVELLAKVQKKYRARSIRQLIAELEEKGLTGIGSVKTTKNHWKSGRIRINDYILAIFELDEELLDEECYHLMKQFAVLPNLSISIDLLKDINDPKLKYNLENSLNELLEQGWIQETENEGYLMHMVIGEVLRRKLKPKYEDCAVLVRYYSEQLHINPTDNPVDRFSLLPYVVKLLTYVKEENEVLAILNYNLSRVYKHLENYKKSLNCQYQALAIWEKKGTEKHHSNIGRSYTELGIAYNYLGNHSRALSYQLKAVEIQKGVFNGNSIDLGRSYCYLALIYSNLGEFQKGVEAGIKSTKIFEITSNENHPYLAKNYNYLAAAYGQLEEYDKALDLYFKAIEIQKKVLGEEHIDLLETYCNLSLIYFYKGDFNNAIDYQVQVIKAEEKYLGQKRIGLAMSYNQLALYYKGANDFEQALNYLLKSIEIHKEVSGLNHPELGNSYCNLGIFYNTLNDFDKALIYSKKALKIYKEISSDYHLSFVYHNLGLIHKNLKDYQKSLAYEYKSIEIRKKVFGLEHVRLADCYAGLAEVYAILEDGIQAKSYIDKAVAIYEKSFPKGHPRKTAILELQTKINK